MAIPVNNADLLNRLKAPLVNASDERNTKLRTDLDRVLAVINEQPFPSIIQIKDQFRLLTGRATVLGRNVAIQQREILNLETELRASELTANRNENTANRLEVLNIEEKRIARGHNHQLATLGEQHRKIEVDLKIAEEREKFMKYILYGVAGAAAVVAIVALGSLVFAPVAAKTGLIGFTGNAIVATAASPAGPIAAGAGGTAFGAGFAANNLGARAMVPAGTAEIPSAETMLADLNRDMDSVTTKLQTFYPKANVSEHIEQEHRDKAVEKQHIRFINQLNENCLKLSPQTVMSILHKMPLELLERSSTDLRQNERWVARTAPSPTATIFLERSIALNTKIANDVRLKEQNILSVTNLSNLRNELATMEAELAPIINQKEQILKAAREIVLVNNNHTTRLAEIETVYEGLRQRNNEINDRIRPLEQNAIGLQNRINALM